MPVKRNHIYGSNIHNLVPKFVYNGLGTQLVSSHKRSIEVCSSVKAWFNVFAIQVNAKTFDPDRQCEQLADNIRLDRSGLYTTL